MPQATRWSTLQILLALGAVLFTCVAVVVVAIGSMKPDSWKNRYRLLLLGGGFSFLSGISLSAYMLIDNPDYRALPLLPLFSLAWGLIGVAFVFRSVWVPRWWHRNRSTDVDNKQKKGECGKPTAWTKDSYSARHR